MSKDAKLIRGQVRQVIKEVLPELLAKELTEEIFKKLMAHLNNRMDFVSTNAADSIAKLDNRQKEMHSYIVRQLNLAVTPAVPTEAPLAAPAQES